MASEVERLRMGLSALFLFALPCAFLFGIVLGFVWLCVTAIPRMARDYKRMNWL